MRILIPATVLGIFMSFKVSAYTVPAITGQLSPEDKDHIQDLSLEIDYLEYYYEGDGSPVKYRLIKTEKSRIHSDGSFNFAAVKMPTSMGMLKVNLSRNGTRLKLLGMNDGTTRGAYVLIDNKKLIADYFEKLEFSNWSRSEETTLVAPSGQNFKDYVNQIFLENDLPYGDLKKYRWVIQVNSFYYHKKQSNRYFYRQAQSYSGLTSRNSPLPCGYMGCVVSSEDAKSQSANQVKFKSTLDEIDGEEQWEILSTQIFNSISLYSYNLKVALNVFQRGNEAIYDRFDLLREKDSISNSLNRGLKIEGSIKNEVLKEHTIPLIEAHRVHRGY